MSNFGKGKFYTHGGYGYFENKICHLHFVKKVFSTSSCEQSSLTFNTVYIPIESRYPIEAHPPFREQKLHANVYICNKMERLSNQNNIKLYKIFFSFCSLSICWRHSCPPPPYYFTIPIHNCISHMNILWGILRISRHYATVSTDTSSWTW